MVSFLTIFFAKNPNHVLGIDPEGVRRPRGVNIRKDDKVRLAENPADLFLKEILRSKHGTSQ